jgi:hypothetical protein
LTLGGGVGRDLGELGQPRAFLRRAALLALPLRRARWRQLVQRGVGTQPGSDRDVVRQAGERARGVGGVADHMDHPVFELRGEQAQQLPSQPGFRGSLGVGLVLGDLLAPRAPEPEKHQQTDGPLKEWQLDVDPGGDPVVAPRERSLAAVGGRVVMPEAAEHLPSSALGQRVVDRDNKRLIGRQQTRDDHLGHLEPKLIGAPAGVTEEPVRTSVMPDPGQPRADQHPGHAPHPGLGDLTDHQRAERPVGGAGETCREQEQQLVQRRGQAEHRRRTSVGSRERASHPAAETDLTPTASRKPPMLLPLRALLLRPSTQQPPHGDDTPPGSTPQKCETRGSWARKETIT